MFWEIYTISAICVILFNVIVCVVGIIMAKKKGFSKDKDSKEKAVYDLVFGILKILVLAIIPIFNTIVVIVWIFNAEKILGMSLEKAGVKKF